MPSPSTAQTTLRPDLAGSLEEFDLAMDRQGFIGYQVMPILEVAKPVGIYGKIPLEELLQSRDIERAPGTGYARGGFRFTKDSYVCLEYGVEEPVDDKEAEMYSEFFVAEQVATARAVDGVLREAEKRAAAAIFNTAVWTGAALTTAVGTSWATWASATPITDIENACRKVWTGSGLWPDTLVIARETFRNLRQCAEVRARITASGAGDVDRAAEITLAQLAQVFDLPKILVGGGAKNTANLSAAASIGSIWSRNRAMVCKTANTQDIREPCIARALHWAEDGSSPGGTIETYREDRVRSEIVRCRHDIAEKIMLVEAGHLLTNTNGGTD